MTSVTRSETAGAAGGDVGLVPGRGSGPGMWVWSWDVGLVPGRGSGPGMWVWSRDVGLVPGRGWEAMAGERRGFPCPGPSPRTGPVPCGTVRGSQRCLQSTGSGKQPGLAPVPLPACGRPRPHRAPVPVPRCSCWQARPRCRSRRRWLPCAPYGAGVQWAAVPRDGGSVAPALSSPGTSQHYIKTNKKIVKTILKKIITARSCWVSGLGGFPPAPKQSV